MASLRPNLFHLNLEPNTQARSAIRSLKQGGSLAIDAKKQTCTRFSPENKVVNDGQGKEVLTCLAKQGNTAIFRREIGVVESGYSSFELRPAAGRDAKRTTIDYLIVDFQHKEMVTITPVVHGGDTFVLLANGIYRAVSKTLANPVRYSFAGIKMRVVTCTDGNSAYVTSNNNLIMVITEDIATMKRNHGSYLSSPSFVNPGNPSKSAAQWRHIVGIGGKTYKDKALVDAWTLAEQEGFSMYVQSE